MNEREQALDLLDRAVKNGKLNYDTIECILDEFYLDAETVKILTDLHLEIQNSSNVLVSLQNFYKSINRPFPR